jgi:hypothetical protein
MKIAGMFISVLMLVIWSAAGYALEVDDTMVLALSFDEGKGAVAKDASQYGNDGKIDGTKWVDGKFGKALEFDGAGTECVTVPDTPELLLMEGGTLMAWSYIMTEAGHASWPRIMIKAADNGGTTSGYDFLFDRASGYSIRFCVTACQSHFPMETDSWHHVAVTFDGETIKVYADGENVSEIPQPGPTVDSTGFDLHIGNGAAFDRAFHGIHDEVRIWNRALDEDEINEAMELGTPQLVAVAPRSKLAITWAQIKDLWAYRHMGS